MPPTTKDQSNQWSLANFMRGGDPMETHKKQANKEMVNPTADPFMVNQLRPVGEPQRPRCKVRILQATGLPESEKRSKATYATCTAKGKKSSTFRTRDSGDPVNPNWSNENAQMLNRWVPGDTLVVSIYDKADGWMSMMSSDVHVAECIIRPDQYYPGGLRARLPLQNARGNPLPGATLTVQIDLTGVAGQSCWQRMTRSCGGGFNCSAIIHFFRELPQMILAVWWSIIGEPAPDRNKGDMWMLIVFPLVSFIFLTWCAWILRHFNDTVMTFFNIIVFCFAAGAILAGVTTHKNSKTAYLALGCLMLLAAILAIVHVEDEWNHSWRLFWWMHTGNRLGASASTPALARGDAAVITFETVKNGTAWTSVDASRAAGFRKGGNAYCAAPILDPTIAAGDIMRVEYWAIGINCCDNFGSFTCDSARDMKGQGAGVVMKGGGMPCWDCHEEEFRLAALKSAGANGMVSAPGAMYVRYVDDSSTVINSYLAKCMFTFFWSLLLGGALFGFLGWLTNYKALGRPGHFPLYHFLDRRKDPMGAPLLNERPAEAQNAVDDKWTLVLSRSADPNAFNVSAKQPQDTGI
jgi:hypothetical protein